MKFQFSKKYNNNTPGGLLLHAVTAVVIVIALSLLYFYVYLPGTTNHDESITVPNVEGMDIAKVASFLAEHDLRYEINDSSYSSEYPPLAVLKQVPAAGARVKENRKIYLSVNRINPPTVPVPDLLDGSLVNAEAVLKGSELKRGKVTLVRGPFLNVVKEMRIEGKEVVPGARVPKGTTIDLVLMDGYGDRGPTPNVLGKTFADANVLIRGNYFSVGKVTAVGDTTGGVVIQQNPAPGENIHVGDVVDLWIGQPGSSPDDADDNDDLEDLLHNP